ncbi:MAG: SDR family oxidoreductase [Hyphomicrobiaceae bacterium]|nr:SDR family oxidoreductase [Hyphomicrobiaceae bacterium]
MAALRPEDDPGLDGKVAIIAGGGSPGDGVGNGRAAAILLARAGSKVLVVDSDRAAAEKTVAMIAGEGGAAKAMSADVTSPRDCEAIVTAALDHFGRLDYLDNNVGIGSRGSVVDETLEGWQKVMRTNVDSMFLLSKYAIPAMIKTAKGGAIVNVSSISALRPRGLTAYAVSKGAVITLTRAMAVDHGRDGIRVNCVAPGPMFTPRMEKRGMSAEGRERRRKASILGIEGTGWDIGHAVKFLLSDHARYITGHTLVVDGGVTAQAPARDNQ